MENGLNTTTSAFTMSLFQQVGFTRFFLAYVREDLKHEFTADRVEVWEHWNHLSKSLWYLAAPLTEALDEIWKQTDPETVDNLLLRKNYSRFERLSLTLKKASGLFKCEHAAPNEDDFLSHSERLETVLTQAIKICELWQKRLEADNASDTNADASEMNLGDSVMDAFYNRSLKPRLFENLDSEFFTHAKTRFDVAESVQNLSRTVETFQNIGFAADSSEYLEAVLKICMESRLCCEGLFFQLAMIQLQEENLVATCRDTIKAACDATNGGPELVTKSIQRLLVRIGSLETYILPDIYDRDQLYSVVTTPDSELNLS